MSELIVAAMVFVLSMIFITVDVYPEDWDKPQAVCSANGGVKRLTIGVFVVPVATCANGAVFVFEDVQP